MLGKENKGDNRKIKIATWNINSLRKRKPVNILPLLKSDIVCLQETKLSKNNVIKDIIAVEELGFQPPCLRFANKKRYSGTATYCRKTLSIIGEESLQSQDIDEEGRCIITKHKIGLDGNTKGLAVINIYIPYIKKTYSPKCKHNFKSKKEISPSNVLDNKTSYFNHVKSSTNTYLKKEGNSSQCDESISQSDKIKSSQNVEINSNQNDEINFNKKDVCNFNQTNKKDYNQIEERNCKQKVERNSNKDNEIDCYESEDANSNLFDEQNFNLNEITNYHQNKESSSDKSDNENDERSSNTRCEEISNSNEMTSDEFIKDTFDESNEMRSINSNENQNHRSSIETNGKRQEYLLRFLQLVSEKCKEYLNNDFNVILLGDFNFPHKKTDCYNHKHFDDEVYTICRKWIDNIINGNQRDPQMASKELFCDMIRKFNFEKQHCYTNWHIQTGKRRKNKYGRRIDYILCNTELAKYAESCQIRKSTKGSDHCPVVLTIKATPLSVENNSESFTESEKNEAESICQRNINLETQQELKQVQEKKKRGRKRKITETSKEEPCAKNPIKRRGRPPKIKDTTSAEGQDLSTETSINIKRKRGRPPKIKDTTSAEGKDLSTETSIKIKRKRGRPPKVKDTTSAEGQDHSTETSIKINRKRGRPPKIKDTTSAEGQDLRTSELSRKFPQKRGRPRKIMVLTIKEEQYPSISEPFMKTKKKRGRPCKIMNMIKKEQEDPIFVENYEGQGTV